MWMHAKMEERRSNVEAVFIAVINPVDVCGRNLKLNWWSSRTWHEVLRLKFHLHIWQIFISLSLLKTCLIGVVFKTLLNFVWNFFKFAVYHLFFLVFKIFMKLTRDLTVCWMFVLLASRPSFLYRCHVHVIKFWLVSGMTSKDSVITWEERNHLPILMPR